MTDSETIDWTEPLPLFVYGTLRPGLGNYAIYCADVAASADASVAARLVEMPDGYPAIVLDLTVPTVRTVGSLLTFADTAAAFARIDVLEGFRPGGDAPLGVAEHHYRRIVVEAARADGAAVRCWTYALPASEAEAGRRVPSGDWIAHGGRTI